MDVEQIEAAIRTLAARGRWADVERVGKLALDLAMAERQRAPRTPEDHVALAERDVRFIAEEELETEHLEVVPSEDPLVETLAVGARAGFVGFVAGMGDTRFHFVRARHVGYQPVGEHDYLASIFLTTERQARAVLEALTRAWPHL